MHALHLSFQHPFAKQAAGHSKNDVGSEAKDKQCPSLLHFILLLHDFLQFSCCQTEAVSGSALLAWALVQKIKLRAWVRMPFPSNLPTWPCVYTSPVHGFFWPLRLMTATIWAGIQPPELWATHLLPNSHGSSMLEKHTIAICVPMERCSREHIRTCNLSCFASALLAVSLAVPKRPQEEQVTHSASRLDCGTFSPPRMSQ